jgi:hypothetical protein
MATNIRSTYPTGQSQTTVDPSGPDPNAYLMALLSRERDQLAKAPVFRTKRPPRVGGGGNSGRVPNTARPVMDGPREGAGSGSASTDRLAELKQMDQYEGSLKGAATRPTGLGAQMIPGMNTDPRLLPSRLLPSNSSFSSGGLSDTQVARLNPEVRRQMEEDEADRQKQAQAAQPEDSWELQFFKQFGRAPSTYEVNAFKPQSR